MPCITIFILQMVIGNNHKALIGHLKYVQDEDEILQWSLTAAGGVLLIILVVVILVCIYRRRRAAGQLPDDESMHLSDNVNRSMKLDYTGRVYGVGAQGTRAVLREDNMATGLRDVMSLRPRNKGETGPVRWVTSGHEGSSHLRHMGQHGVAHTVDDFDDFDIEYLSPDTERDSKRDHPIPGVYVVAS